MAAAAKPAAKAATPAAAPVAKAAKAPSAKPAAGAKPSAGISNRLSAPRGGKADNLTRIKGIGSVNEKKLNDHGIYHFDQIDRGRGVFQVAAVAGQRVFSSAALGAHHFKESFDAGGAAHGAGSFAG